MKGTLQTRRRVLGAVALTLAGLMLVLGETVLNQRFAPPAFILYWLICFLLTITAIVVAFADVKDLQRKAGREQRDLLEGTFDKIEEEARDRKRG
jgi:hypothetical protein